MCMRWWWWIHSTWKIYACQQACDIPLIMNIKQTYEQTCLMMNTFTHVCIQYLHTHKVTHTHTHTHTHTQSHTCTHTHTHTHTGQTIKNKTKNRVIIMSSITIAETRNVTTITIMQQRRSRRRRRVLAAVPVVWKQIVT